MAKSYGVPYMGSKNSIAPWIVEHLPRAEVLVEPFAGGCAVTHCALEAGAFERFVCNDIVDAPQLFVDAIAGKYADEERWISREDFFMFKDADPYIRYCWSFGNNGRDYLYSREIEPLKHALWELIVKSKTQTDRARNIRAYIKAFYNLLGVADDCTQELLVKKFAQSQSVQRLQRLQSLQKLKPLLSRITVTQSTYNNMDIPPNATIYCDPPYRGTQQYNGSTFDFDAFDEWVDALPQMAVISEYTAPAGCVEVARIDKTCSLSATNNSKVSVERLFVQERFADEYRERVHTEDVAGALFEGKQAQTTSKKRVSA